jgi:hypothetical protein
MMRSILFHIALAGLVLSPPAQACSYSQAPEGVGQSSGQYFAKVMLEAAAYADLVLVEDDGTRPMNEPPTGVITLRTIARFKGNSADRFTLFGSGLTLRPESETVAQAPLQHFTSETGHVTPFSYSEERVRNLFPANVSDPPAPPAPMTSCSPDAISAETGRFYIVLRGADGRLLNSIPISDGTKAATIAPAFGFVPVNLKPDDFWLYAVRIEALGLATTGGTAVVHLKPGSDATSAERSIRKAGGTIRAAYFARGNLIEEVRPSPHEQTLPWLAKAASFLVGSQRGRIGDPHHSAAELLRDRLSPMQRYGTGLGYEVAQAFARSIHEAQAATGTSRLIALEVVGDAHSFVGLPMVARVAPLDRASVGLPQLAGDDDAAQFATMQRIERDIWLLNGGNGNRQGTLP